MGKKKTKVQLTRNRERVPVPLMLVIIYSVVQGFLAISSILMLDDLTGTGGISSTELIAYLALAVLSFAIAVALGRMYKWGLVLARGTYGLAVTLEMILLFSTGIESTNGVLSMGEVVLDVLVLFYLFQPQTKSLFK